MEGIKNKRESPYSDKIVTVQIPKLYPTSAPLRSLRLIFYCSPGLPLK